ncbi:hypothetical protein D9757_002368 [Collybiopsis confluens]|uniref:Cytoplasmic tRNA 2-thiolation protein 2 n=1 Tax=Collybiopsis confluens TaxID=2823264 RepID=A0A8H5MF07_9AGAR|nr:hypothetical protein D9757_002368 [Collybiopsis confluens]
MSADACGNPAVETEATMDRRLKYDRSKACIKCKINAGRIVVRHAVYCKDCFPTLLSTKVKRSLEPHINPRTELSRRKSLKASGNLLIGFSGGLGSTVLLDLISKIYLSNRNELRPQDPTDGKARGGKDHPRNEPVWQKASMTDRGDEIKSLMQDKYQNLELIALRLEDAFDRKWWDQVGGRASTDVAIDVTNEDLYSRSISTSDMSDPIQKLRSYLSALPTHTAIDNAIRTLTRLLLLHTARRTQSSHLLLGTSLTSLSIRLISSISEGGGFAIREEAQEEWHPGNSSSSLPIRLIRPMQEITMKECSLWAWWNDLYVIGKEKRPGGKQGIAALTKDFIVGLERDYPSTVSTIARTCAKLAPKAEAVGSCILCERPLQPGVQEWKSRISIRATAPSSPSSAPVLRSLAPLLCYSCHTSLTSRSSKSISTKSENSPTPLPFWASAHLNALNTVNAKDEGGDVWITRRVGHNEMKGAIGEFLLE